jgi:hypothetical protein
MTQKEKKMNTNSTKKTNFRTWKKGKQWLFAAALAIGLTLVAGGISAQAATTNLTAINNNSLASQAGITSSTVSSSQYSSAQLLTSSYTAVASSTVSTLSQAQSALTSENAALSAAQTTESIAQSIVTADQTALSSAQILLSSAQTTLSTKQSALSSAESTTTYIDSVYGSYKNTAAGTDGMETWQTSFTVTQSYNPSYVPNNSAIASYAASYINELRSLNGISDSISFSATLESIAVADATAEAKNNSMGDGASGLLPSAYPTQGWTEGAGGPFAMEGDSDQEIAYHMVMGGTDEGNSVDNGHRFNGLYGGTLFGVALEQASNGYWYEAADAAVWTSAEINMYWGSTASGVSNQAQIEAEWTANTLKVIPLPEITFAYTGYQPNSAAIPAAQSAVAAAQLIVSSAQAELSNFQAKLTSDTAALSNAANAVSSATLAQSSDQAAVTADSTNVTVAEENESTAQTWLSGLSVAPSGATNSPLVTGFVILGLGAGFASVVCAITIIGLPLLIMTVPLAVVSLGLAAMLNAGY